MGGFISFKYFKACTTCKQSNGNRKQRDLFDTRRDIPRDLRVMACLCMMAFYIVPVLLDERYEHCNFKGFFSRLPHETTQNIPSRSTSLS